MFSISVNIFEIALEMSCLSWTRIAGLSPSAFSIRSLAAADVPPSVFTMTCMSDGSVTCGVRTSESSMMPRIMSLPS